MTSNIKPLYIYMQRPDIGTWVTVGAYAYNPETKIGKFRYARSYAAADLAWSIDPVNLPFRLDTEFDALRYGGLHDVLRDATPDAWGKSLLTREGKVPGNAPEYKFFELASNADRWGALAVGPTAKPPSIGSLPPGGHISIEEIAREIVAISENKDAINTALRKRIFGTPSGGGARPKTTIRHGDHYWMVKPRLPTDSEDIPMLEHFASVWGTLAGLNFARTEFHPSPRYSVVRVLRFDRDGTRRRLCLSATSMLQAEYPGSGLQDNLKWSYPRFAEELQRIGAPVSDRQELFFRMVFNAVIGNDDDHPRNHAAYYLHEEGQWRLSPAFDVVPNPDETPAVLCMQLATGVFAISREALIAEPRRFGWAGGAEAGLRLDEFLRTLEFTFEEAANVLSPSLRKIMAERIQFNLRLLKSNIPEN